MAQNLEFNAVVSANQLNKLLDELRTGSESAAKAINSAFGGTVTKTILLETVTDVNGARKLVATERERLSVTDKIINQQRQLNKIEQGSVTNLRQQLNEAKQARDQVAKYSTSMGVLGGQVRTVNGEWTRANARVAELNRQLNVASASSFWQRVKADLNLGGLSSFSNGLVQITQGFQAASIVAGQFLGSINQVIVAASNLQQFELAFKAIGAGASASTQALSESSRIALGLGVNLQTAQEAFQQLSPVVLNTGGSLSDVSGIVETLSSRFAAFGISGDKARRVTNGIIQAFAKGKLQAEELTQQISEADPAFKTDFARALQVAGVSVSGTTKELEELVKAGRVTAEVLRDTLPLISKSTLLFGKLGPTGASAVDALAGGSVTIEQVQQNLRNLNELSLRRLATAAEPAIVSFLRLQAVVVDFLTNLSKTGAAQTFFDLISRITDAATNLISGFLSLAQTVVNIVNVFAPLINVLTKIPGLFELIGLAVIAKFLKPLKESGGAVGGFLSAQSNLGSRLQQLWAGIASKTFLPYIDARDKALKAAAAPAPSDIGVVQKELKVNKDIIGLLRERRIEEAKSKSAVIDSARTRIKEIDKITRAQSLLTRSASRAIGGSGSGLDQESLALVRKLADERQKLTQVINDESLAIQRRVTSETDLNRVLGDTSSFGRSVLRDTRALGLAVDVTREKWNVYKNALRANRAEASGLKQEQAKLGAQLGKLPVGSKDASRLKEEYAALGQQIQSLADREKALVPIARESATQARDAAKAKRDYTKQTQGAGGAAQFFGARLKGLGSGVTGVLGAIKGLGGQLLAAFGPVGIILAAVSAAQSAYSDATASARVESEKSAEIAKVLTQRNQELAEAIKRAREEAGGTGTDITPDVNVKQLSAFQVLWGEIGDAIANTWGFISGESQKGSKGVSSSINQLVADIEKVQASGIINANLFEGLARPEDAAALRDVSERIASVNVQFKQFAKESTVASQSVTANSAQLTDNIAKLQELADASRDGALANKDFTSGFDQATKSLEQEESRLQDIRDKIAQYEKLEPRGLDAQSLKDFAALRTELKQSEGALAAARDKTEKLGLATGALASQATRTATSMQGLNEALQGANAALEAAAFGSDQFQRAATQAFVLQTAIEKAQNAAKDPILLEAGLSQESVRIAEEINRLQAKRSELMQDPIANQKELVRTEKELAGAIERSKQTLEARSVINVRLAIKELEFQADLKKINDQIGQDQIKLAVGIDKPELRAALTQITEFRNRVRQLQDEGAIIRTRLQDPTLTSEQRQDLGRQQVQNAQQTRAELTKGAAELRDASARLRESAIDARRNLLNLKLNNLDLLPPEQQREAIRQLDAEVQRIANERGLTFKFRGNRDEILQQKQRVVDFYNQVDTAEKRITDLDEAIKRIDSEIQRLSEAGLGEIFNDAVVAAEQLGIGLTNAADAATTMYIAIADAGTASQAIGDGLQEGAEQIQSAAESLLNLDGKSINIDVNYSSPPPGRWMGGPVSAGAQYQVNELGQEGFLSASGRISAINRPRNGLWRAPSSGTVIPADIWAGLRVPSVDIRANSPVSSGFSGDNGLTKVARAIQAGMMRNAASSGVNELAAVQAHQALQIGKLGRAVDDLASKDWNVNVKVKNYGNGAFLEALNHRM